MCSSECIYNFFFIYICMPSPPFPVSVPRFK